MKKREKPIKATYTLSPDVVDGLRALRDRDGIPAATAINRVMRAYLIEQGIIAKRSPK